MKKAARKKRVANGTLLPWIVDVALKHKDKNACLTWPFGRNSGGYGVIRYQGRMTVAHLVICKLYRGVPSSNKITRHICGNGHEGCVNPHHLRWGTHKQNTRDIVTHGRRPVCHGEHHSQSVLNDAKVINILKLLDKGVKIAKVAARYGVAYSTISNIKQGIRWKHIDRSTL